MYVGIFTLVHILYFIPITMKHYNKYIVTLDQLVNKKYLGTTTPQVQTSGTEPKISQCCWAFPKQYRISLQNPTVQIEY